ncbi:MAG: tripartite tricarboxylate transporter substrate binding protein [Piscinibacter sp.]
MPTPVIAAERWRLRALLAVPALLAALWPAAVAAQAWPARQAVRLVVVFPPGGSVDQVARILAPVLQQRLGQSVVVENKGGASGAIGTAAVVQAPADGYTFAVVFDTHGVNPALQPGLSYDTKRDLVAVSLIGTGAMVITTVASSPYKSFADVVKVAQGGTAIAYGSIGSGSLGHLAVTMLAKAGKLELTHVPYRGGGPLMSDAIAGHVPLAVGSVFLAKPHIDSGKLRALAVTTSQRSANLPGVPTLAESGFAGFDAPAWWAVLAPAKTPAEIVQRMNEEINAALRQPEVADKLAAQGIVTNVGTAAMAQTFIETQLDTWAKVVKANDIKAD